MNEVELNFAPQKWLFIDKPLASSGIVSLVFGSDEVRVDGAPPQDELAGNRRVATLALLSFAVLIVSLDQYIVVVALPDIGRDLGYSSQTLQSVISAYAVASSGFLLFGGRATDLLGRRRVLATGLASHSCFRPLWSSPLQRLRVRR